MDQSFSAEDVRIGHTLYLCESYCITSSELYSAGRRADVLLAAARPMTEVLPWLETELRAHPDEMKEFMSSVSAIGAEIRRDPRPRAVRKCLKRMLKARVALLDRVVGGTATDEAYRASVGVALVDTVSDVYSRATASQKLDGYQAVYGATRTASELLSDGARRDPAVAAEVASLQTAFPAFEPPGMLVRPEDVAAIAERLAAAASRGLGARSMRGGLEDGLAKVDRLLDDVVAAYVDGVPALSARLAASLFVRSFDPVRPEFERVRPDDAQRLTQLLGINLRRSINNGAPAAEIEAIAAEARVLLRAETTEIPGQGPLT